ncbi:MAG TPA: metallophosphoesterase [Phycisphaerae bacterium]|nr:metallophosphoesterase [Phycisphaerae bacterium]
MRTFRGRLVVLLTLIAVSVSPARAGEPWRLIVVGDSRGEDNGVNTVILTEIATHIVAEQPDVVLFPGDLVEGDTDTEGLISQLTTWRTTMLPVYSAGARVLAVRGNHEDTGSVEAWNAVFDGLFAMPGNGPVGEVNVTYSMVRYNAFVVGLDEYSDHPGRVNQTWLDAQLAANTRAHVFVFGHEPAFRAGHEDCLDVYPADRDVFWASITNAGGRTYLCGHDHFYDHARIDDQDSNPDNDVHQLIVGTGGAPLVTFDGIYDGDNGDMIPCQQYYASAYGYVRVDIHDLQVTLTWVERVDANVFMDMETWSYSAAPRPGDLTCDGMTDWFDADAFVLALIDPAAYSLAYPDCSRMLADVNGDGNVDGRDIDPFVVRLIGE